MEKAKEETLLYEALAAAGLQDSFPEKLFAQYRRAFEALERSLAERHPKKGLDSLLLVDGNAHAHGFGEEAMLELLRLDQALVGYGFAKFEGVCAKVLGGRSRVRATAGAAEKSKWADEAARLARAEDWAGLGEMIGEGKDIWGSGSDGLTLMGRACKDKNFALAQKLLKMEAPVNDADAGGMRPLHWACSSNCGKIALLLLSHGAHMEMRDSKGRSAGHWAASHEEPEALRALAARGALTDYADCDGMTPMHYAAKRSSAAACEILSEAGCLAILKDNAGHAPSHYARAGSNAAALAFLLQKEAEESIEDQVLKG